MLQAENDISTLNSNLNVIDKRVYGLNQSRFEVTTFSNANPPMSQLQSYVSDIISWMSEHNYNQTINAIRYVCPFRKGQGDDRVTILSQYNTVDSPYLTLYCNFAWPVNSLYIIIVTLPTGVIFSAEKVTTTSIT